MKRIVTLVALVGLTISARAALADPGAVISGTPPTGPVVLLDDSLSQTQPETFVYTLSFGAQSGWLVLVENNITGNPVTDGQSRANWSDVVHFDGTDGKQVTLYSWDDWSGLPALPPGVKYIYENNAGVENGPGLFTTYVPNNANGQPDGVTYQIESVVPEPTTMIAGALLLLPFGASTLRMLRRRTA